ncbi:CPCC family cysteine-rich protein [Pseudomonas sp. NPDC087342]|uniref:CPCC family cysteine-rich protein n=1 Tax=Pseudomonas sp. NPDC087342 TaxID=3364437 RepID=UPI00382B2C07
MTNIHRNTAIKILIKEAFSTLTHDARESCILNWWGINENDLEFSLLSKELQHQLLANEELPTDTQNKLYDELVIVALSCEYKGVTNAYITGLLHKMGMSGYEVDGDVERLEACPCCGFRTLPSRSNYDICGLCSWEDNGVNDINRYSGPNRMKLGEAKEQFLTNMNALPLNKWAK